MTGAPSFGQIPSHSGAEPRVAEPKALPPPIDVLEAGVLLRQLLAHFSSTFVGAYASRPGAKTMVTPEGIEVASEPDKQFGAVLDRVNAALMFGGLTVAQGALVVAASVLKEATGTEPDWDFSEDNAAKTRVRVNDATDTEVTVTERPIEPWFDNRSVPGVTILIQIKKAER